MNAKRSNEVAGGKDVVWVDSVFETLQNANTCFSHAPFHELLPKLPNTVMVRDASSEFHDFIPGSILNFPVGLERVSNTFNAEPEVNVDNCSGVINL
jgi:hypothetical protein